MRFQVMFSEEVFPSRRNSRLQPEKSNQQRRLLRVFQRVHLYPHMSANRSHIKTPCSSKGCEQLFNLQVASNFSNQLECTQLSVHRKNERSPKKRRFHPFNNSHEAESYPTHPLKLHGDSFHWESPTLAFKALHR